MEKEAVIRNVYTKSELMHELYLSEYNLAYRTKIVCGSFSIVLEKVPAEGHIWYKCILKARSTALRKTITKLRKLPAQLFKVEKT